MNAVPIVLGTLLVTALGYRYYSAFIAAKVLALDDRRRTPAHEIDHSIGDGARLLFSRIAANLYRNA